MIVPTGDTTLIRSMAELSPQATALGSSPDRIMSWFCGATGDLTGAKGAETVLSLTAHVRRELGVSDRQPVTQENLDA